MGTRLRSWRQKIKQHPVAAVLTALLVVVIVLVVLSVLGYIFNWNWTGLGSYIPPTKAGNFQRGKTLWDWLQLLIIPAVLAVGGYLFNYTTSRNEQKASVLHNQTEREIASDNQREAALQAYIDNMSELLLHEKLRESGPNDEVRKIARVRTLTVLPRLDAERQGSVLQFLHESGLIDKGRSIVDLHGADLSGAILDKADLRGADLPFTGRFFIKRPTEPDEPWTSCSSSWEPRAWLATVPARSGPAPAQHRGSTCRQS